MKLPFLSVLPFLAFAVLLGCQRKTVVIELPPSTPSSGPVAKTKTLETSRLGSAIDDYAQERTNEHHAAVKKAMADLDGEIAELEALVAKRTGPDREEAATKLANLQSYRTAETVRFTAAEAGAPIPKSSDQRAGRTGVDKAEDAAKKVGNSIENAARKTGEAIKDAER